MNYGEKIENPAEVGTYDGIVIIICKSLSKTGIRCKEITLTAEGTEDDRFLSLEDCINEIGFDKTKGDCVISVVMESLLSGHIYQYGNHGPFWELHGKTQGYA